MQNSMWYSKPKHVTALWGSYVETQPSRCGGCSKTGSFCPDHQKIQLLNLFDTLPEFYHERHFFGIDISIRKMSVCKYVAQRSNLTTRKSTENKNRIDGRLLRWGSRMRRWGWRHLGRRWGNEGSGWGLQSRAVGPQGSMTGEGRRQRAPTKHVCSKLPSTGESDRIIIVKPSRQDHRTVGREGGKCRERPETHCSSLYYHFSYSQMCNFCFDKMVFKTC